MSKEINHTEKRKLSAIMFTDIKGFAKKMGENENGTFNLLIKYSHIINPIVDSYDGRVVKTMGDAIMGDFTSVLNAVNCALSIQKKLFELNKNSAESEIFHIRIGIQLGDVIISGDDIYGEGVNVASRLESFSDPGGICISETVYELIKDNLPLNYKNVGYRSFKNIKEPIKVYKIPPIQHLEENKQKKSLITSKAFYLSKINRPLFPFLVIIIILSTIFITHNNLKSQIPYNEGDYILIADFENTTGEKFLDHSLSEALKITLSQSPFINILTKNKILVALKRMKLPDNQKLDEKISLEVARRENTSIVIAGNISILGKYFILKYKIMDVLTGEVLKTRRIEVKKLEELYNGIDYLAKHIRKDLGESKKRISKSMRPLEDVTTSSLEALELYTKADFQESQGNYNKAIIFLEKAISIDSLFTSAISNLSYNYRKIGNHDKAIYYHKKILPLIDRVSDKEKYCILTIYYGSFFEYDYQKAFKYAKHLTSLYPNDAIGHGMLGHLAMQIGDYETAIESNMKCIKLDTTQAPMCYNNIGFTNALFGNTDEALKYFKKSKKIRPNYLSINGNIAQLFWMSDKIDSTEILLKSIYQKSDKHNKITIHTRLAGFYFFQGKLKQTYNECLAGIKICQELNCPEKESYFQYLLAEMEKIKGNKDNYLQRIEKTIQLSESPYFELFLAGLSLADLGYYDKAFEIIENIDSDDPFFTKLRSTYKNIILGEISCAKSEFKNAITHYKKITKLYSGDPIYWLTQKKIASCTSHFNIAEAIQQYRKILNHKGEIFMSYLPSHRKGGLWTGELWSETIFTIGTLHLQNQDTTMAIQYLNNALYYWQNADNDYNKYKKANILINKIRIE